MSEITFYFNKNEISEFVKYIISKNGIMIPDLDYVVPKPLIIANDSEFENTKSENLLYFIINNSYTKYPLDFQRIDKNDKEIYYIRQRYGGPVINFTPRNIIGKDICPSDIHYYQFVYLKNNDGLFLDKFSASSEIKNFYKDLTKYIKSNSKRIKHLDRIYWIGKQTVEDLRNGWCLANLTKQDWMPLIDLKLDAD